MLILESEGFLVPCNVKMAGTESDLLTALWINVVTVVAFLIVYVILKNVPVNFRVYHPRRFLNGQVEHVDDVIDSGDKKQHGVSWRSFLHIMDPILSIWRMKEEEFIERYGLDSAVLLRTFLLGYDSRLINSGFVNQSVTLVVDGCDKLCLNIKPLFRRRLFFSRCIMSLVSASF